VFVIDSEIGAEPAAGVAFLRRAGGYDDASTECLAELNGRGADPRGAAMHEQRFASDELAALEYVVPDRKESFRYRRGLDHRKACRHRQRVASESQAILGVAAADHERHHFVALGPARHAGADLGDFAGDFQAGNFGRPLRRRIVTLPLHNVWPVHARGGNSHQDFAFAW
jgi:hypothetical protein